MTNMKSTSNKNYASNEKKFYKDMFLLTHFKIKC